MRVLVAGATGVVGRRLVPDLLAAGHVPIAMSRSGRVPDGWGDVESEAVDALDAHAVRDMMDRQQPDAVVHLLTQIPDTIHPRRMTRDFRVNNELRTLGLRNLLAGADGRDLERLVVQGLAWGYDPTQVPEGELATEDAPIWTDPPRPWRTSAEALRALASTTAAHDGVELRFGHLYGPGTAFAADGDTTEQVRSGKLPVIGGGSAVYSFTHVRDAAAAVALAIDAGATGPYNIVDDAPAAVHEWLPELATIVGGPRPRPVPAVAARLVAGSWGVAYFTRLRGADNTRARHDLGWIPTVPSWRDGFRAELG